MEKYLPDSYKHRLLDKLHNFCQDSKSVQEYTTDFDDLTLRCEVQEDSYQAIFRYRFGLRSNIQRAMFIHSHKIETLEQASQPAQNIETSFRFFSERRAISKAGEEPNPNTNTTKDPKGKSVIGESSKSVKNSQCFKCQGYVTLLHSVPLETSSSRKPTMMTSKLSFMKQLTV